MIVIDDNIHSDLWLRFVTFEGAVAELKRLAETAWDEPPNRAPCNIWRTCGRDYVVMELDSSQKPSKVLRRIVVLSISAEGVKWADGFESAWAAAEREKP